jgi:hypothetical protein
MPVDLDPAVALCGLAETKQLLGVGATQTVDDDLITTMINTAGDLIHEYTKRQWIKGAAGEERIYRLDVDDVDERSLMVDDLAILTGVVLKRRDGTLLQTLTLADVDALTHTWRAGWPIIELGFPWDVTTPAQLHRDVRIHVTGTWGWAAVPATVHGMAMQTAANWSKREISKLSASIKVEVGRYEIPRVLPDTVKAALALFRHPSV